MEVQKFINRTSCLLCQSKHLETVLSCPFSNDLLWKSMTDQYGQDAVREEWEEVTFDISFCPSCNFYFSKYIPADEFFEKITHRQILSGALPERERRMDLRHYSRLSFECERISSLLKRVPGDISVLEFGSGFGHWLLMAKAFNYQTTGIEIYEDRIAYAEKNALTIHRTLDAVSDEGFDFIFSNQVFEHLNDPLPILKSLVPKLKSGGIIQIGVPQGMEIRKIIFSFTGTLDKLIGPIGHINCFTNKALVTMAKNAGLQLLSSSIIRSRYIATMIKNRDLKYLREILLAGYKQKNSCYLYFTKK